MTTNVNLIVKCFQLFWTPLTKHFNILQNNLFCIVQKKESHSGLERHEND